MSTQPHTHSIVGVSEAMHKLGIVTATKSYAYHDRLEPDTLDYGGYATQNRSFYLYLCMISSFIFSIAARSARARCFFNFLLWHRETHGHAATRIKIRVFQRIQQREGSVLQMKTGCLARLRILRMRFGGMTTPVALPPLPCTHFTKRIKMALDGSPPTGVPCSFLCAITASSTVAISTTAALLCGRSRPKRLTPGTRAMLGSAAIIDTATTLTSSSSNSARIASHDIPSPNPVTCKDRLVG